MLIPNIGKWGRWQTGPLVLLRRYWVYPDGMWRRTNWAKVVVDWGWFVPIRTDEWLDY